MLQLTLNFTLNLAKANSLTEVMQLVNNFIEIQNESTKVSYWTFSNNDWQCAWKTEQVAVNQDFIEIILPYLRDCKVLRKVEKTFLKVLLSELVFIPLLAYEQVIGVMVFASAKESIVINEIKTIFVLAASLATIQLQNIQNIQNTENISVSQALENQKASERENQKENQQSFAGNKVLLVEDTPSYQIIIARFLKNLAIEPIVVATGQDALIKLKEQHFDLVLLDIQLPDIDGLMVATRARQELNFTNPIIAMTADNGDEIEQSIKNVGMNDLIVKPIQQVKLQKLLQLYAKKDYKMPDLTFLQDAANDDKEFMKSMFKMTIIEFEQFEKSFVAAWTAGQIQEMKLLHHKIKPHVESYKLEVIHKILTQLLDNQEYSEKNKLVENLQKEIHIVCEFFRKEYEMA